MVDLPRKAATQGLSLPDLHALLETDYQLVLPAKCSKNYLKQVLKREKLVIHRFTAPHFHLTEASGTKIKALEELARDCEAVRRYLPDERIEDREWLVQVLATVELDLVLSLQCEALKTRKRPVKDKTAS